MKNLIIFFLVIACWGMSGCIEKVDVEREKANIKSVLDKYVDAWETNDIELYLTIFSHDDDMVIFSDIPFKRIVGWETLKKLFRDLLSQWRLKIFHSEM